MVTYCCNYSLPLLIRGLHPDKATPSSRYHVRNALTTLATDHQSLAGPPLPVPRTPPSPPLGKILSRRAWLTVRFRRLLRQADSSTEGRTERVWAWMAGGGSVVDPHARWLSGTQVAAACPASQERVPPHVTGLGQDPHSDCQVPFLLNASGFRSILDLTSAVEPLLSQGHSVYFH